MGKKSLLLMVLCSATLVACGQKQETAAANPAPTTPAVQAATTTVAVAPAPENELGKKTFGSVCSMCHAAGVAGAPKPGDKADWGPRIAQGNDVLYKHALEGFNGSKGAMPARGGSTSLPDDAVKAAVDYMVAKSR